MILSN